MVRLALWFDLLCGSTCFVVRLALWFDLLCGSTCFVVRLALWFDYHRVSTYFALTFRRLFALFDFALSVLVISDFAL